MNQPTDDTIEAAARRLEERWATQRHEYPSPCGSRYCRDGTLVQLTINDSGRHFKEIECPLCQVYKP